MASQQKKLSFREILIRLLPFAKPYAKYIYFSLFLTVVSAFAAQVDPFVLQYLVNQVAALTEAGATISQGLPVLLFSAVILLGKSLLVLLTDFGLGYLGESLKVKIGANLSDTAYNHSLSLGMSFFDAEENATGRLIRRIDRGVEGLSKVIKNLLIDILPLFAKAILSLIVMFSVNVWVGTLALLIIPVYFILSYEQAKRQEGVRIGIHELKEVRTQSMLSSFLSIRVIKSFVREEYEINKHYSQNSLLARNEIRHHIVNRFFDALKFFAGEVGSIIIAIFTSFLILNGQMTVGAILLHLMLFRNVTSPIRDLHRIYDEHNEAITFSYGYFSLLNTPSTEVNRSQNNLTASSSVPNGNISLRDVTFSYIPGRRVLHEINMTLREGQTTALVGLSGAGKTTIASLLVRFYDPESGDITMGSTSLKDLPLPYVREVTGMVLQENHIFDGSIADNIRYGKLDATDEQIQRAAERAQLHSYVKSLSNGYDSPAQQLSGGQKQRIALARVFLKGPSILILDEPTASLDAITSEQIKRALDEVRQRRTVLIISHNISQIVDADYIYVIKDGRIIEEGNHEELYRARGHYTEIIDSNVENMNLKRLMRSVERQEA